ncbi:MAG TPA: hypothetical protein VHC22_28330 [Pirellulales bacterium]|nr:hypothetical protein [Pirellulales bacterium]
MKRRLQFSLRGLLGLAALVCLSLGGRHLLETYGNSLDAEDPKAGLPIRVKARYFCLFGPTECYFDVGYETPDGSQLSDGTLGMSSGELAKRSWLCLYRIESELEPVDQPCQLIFYLYRLEKRWGGGRVWTVKEKIVDVK